MDELGNKIKELRMRLGLSQQQFAESLGYTHKSMINKIELGKCDMSYDKILILLIIIFFFSKLYLFYNCNRNAKKPFSSIQFTVFFDNILCYFFNKLSIAFNTPSLPYEYVSPPC